MPSELRVLRFQMDEVTEALQAFAPRIGLNMPNKPIVWAQAGSGAAPAEACLKLLGCDTDLKVSNDIMTASLISYCQTHDIPIPRAWDKSIFVASDYIELRISNLSKPKPQDSQDAQDSESAVLF